jgi:hypothetical protein
MKKLMFGLLLAFGMTACTLDTDAPKDECGAYTNVSMSGFPLPCNYARKELSPNPAAVVIDSQAKFDAQFTTHANTCDNPTDAAIDFTKYTLIGLYSGQKSTNGYGIKAASIVENACHVVVNFYEYGPQSGETITQNPTYPADYVLIPITDKPVLFNRTSESPDRVIIGSFDGECTGSSTCQKFFQFTDYNIIRFADVVYNSYNFGQYKYVSVTKRGDYTRFLQEVPAEIINLKGQTKTYGSPDTGDKKGYYVEFVQAGTVTKIYIDNDDTDDQSAQVKAFKKTVKDIITAIQ